MSISVTAPLGPSINRTKEVLFQPFDIGKWFVLALGPFLMSLAAPGGVDTNLFQDWSLAVPSPDDRIKAWDWSQNYLHIILPLVLTGFVLFYGVWMVFLWLASRGEFLLLNGVVRNLAEIPEPWRDYGRQGNSLFWFRFWLRTGVMLVDFGILALGFWVAWPELQEGRYEVRARIGQWGAGLSIVVLQLLLVFVETVLHDFVVPIMFLRKVRVLAAWLEFGRSMLAGRVGTLVVYFLFRIVIGIVLMACTIAILLGTCCLAALPYISAVSVLPLVVFTRSYSLYYIEQFGPEWRVFHDQADDLPPLELGDHLWPDEPPGPAPSPPDLPPEVRIRKDREPASGPPDATASVPDCD